MMFADTLLDECTIVSFRSRLRTLIPGLAGFSGVAFRPQRVTRQLRVAGTRLPKSSPDRKSFYAGPVDSWFLKTTLSVNYGSLARRAGADPLLVDRGDAL
jgi:hypothetical protein